MKYEQRWEYHKGVSLNENILFLKWFLQIIRFVGSYQC